ncbi:hypothetical protein C0995_005967, partial [Termitomyces sp. Mi166
SSSLALVSFFVRGPSAELPSVLTCKELVTIQTTTSFSMRIAPRHQTLLSRRRQSQCFLTTVPGKSDRTTWISICWYYSTAESAHWRNSSISRARRIFSLSSFGTQVRCAWSNSSRH